MKTLILISLCFAPIFMEAQLSVHAGARMGNPSLLYTEPYEDHDNEATNVPLVPLGLELGYRFTPFITLRGFYYFLRANRFEFLFSTYSARSSLQLYGLRPQVNLFSNSKGTMHLHLGIPAERIDQDVYWRKQTLGLFSSLDSAGGKDQATSYRLGLSPTFRLNIPSTGFICEASLAFYYTWLHDFRRSIHYDTFYPAIYAEKQGEIRQNTLELRITLGYSFW